MDNRDETTQKLTIANGIPNNTKSIELPSLKNSSPLATLSSGNIFYFTKNCESKYTLCFPY